MNTRAGKEAVVVGGVLVAVYLLYSIQTMQREQSAYIHQMLRFEAERHQQDIGEVEEVEVDEPEDDSGNE
jgi:hypothetical protein